MVTSLLKYLVAPVAVLIIAGIALSSSKVTESTAHTFFVNYYERVTQADQRWTLFRQDLTSNYRKYPHHGWKSYVAYWGAQKHVTVDSVFPVSGNPFEFTVSITLNDSSDEVTVNYWLACNGLIGNLIGRLPPGCPLNDVQIDNGQLVSPTTGLG